jgi:hypothetical protein
MQSYTLAVFYNNYYSNFNLEITRSLKPYITLPLTRLFVVFTFINMSVIKILMFFPDQLFFLHDFESLEELFASLIYHR